MQVVVHQFDGVSTIRALPLAAGLVVASARRQVRADFEIVTARRSPDEAVAQLARPDVLAFSMYVWNERHSLEVARRARARFPAALVVLGGPSVPRHPESAAAFLRAHPFVDVLAFGEGELAFAELLGALEGNRALDAVPGLALRASHTPEGALLTAPRARLADFGDTASPYLDGTFDALIDPKIGAAIVETNRGCPFACTFCDWGQAVASRVQELPLERLHGELAWIANRRIPYIYIVDANYGIRRRDLEIVREIARLKAMTGSPQYVFFHLTKNATERHLEPVLALREAGIATHLALSAQDFEPRVLEAVKRDNIRLDRALALRRICHERGIPTFNELILGLPEQTYSSFARSMAQAITPYPADSFNLYLARLLPNAEMASPAERARHGIETRHVAIASFHQDGAAAGVAELEEVVVATRALPVAEWRRAFKLGFLLAAAYNLQLLKMFLQTALRLQLDLCRLVEGLAARVAAAPAGSALARIDAVLERYAQAILDGRAMALPDDGTGEHLWAVEDAVLIAALADADGFFDEIGAFVREELGAPLLEEALRFQRFITPSRGDRAVRHARFDYDFLAGTPGETRLSWTPSAQVAASAELRGFMLAYLGSVHARVPTGFVTRS